MKLSIDVGRVSRGIEAVRCGGSMAAGVFGRLDCPAGCRTPCKLCGAYPVKAIAKAKNLQGVRELTRKMVLSQARGGAGGADPDNAEHPHRRRPMPTPPAPSATLCRFS
jgi:hypothetical protein